MPRRKSLRILPLLALCCLLAPEAFAISCETVLSDTEWHSKSRAREAAQQVYLEEMKDCLTGDARGQALIDSSATSAIGMMEMNRSLMSPGPALPAPGIMRFVVRTLEINANHGNASSQYHYASLFNARPGSMPARLVPQSQEKFSFWTRAAAAQREPRALFELAVRMADGAPEAGIEKDIETAYKLLVNLQRLGRHYSPATYVGEVWRNTESIMTQTRARLAAELGESRAKTAATQAPGFNYISLTPKRETVAEKWNNERNIRSAVNDFLRTQNTAVYQAAFLKTKECYAAAKAETGLTQAREFCAAFDAANIEFTTAFYQQMAAKFKSSNFENMQPEETRRPAGRQRIIQEMTDANIDNPETVVDSVYRQAADVLAGIVATESAQRNSQPNAAR